MTASDEALRHALAQREGGDLSGAIHTLWGAISDDLADPELALNLAKMLSEAGQLERAAPWFKHAMKLAPDDLDLRLAYGTWLGQTGDAEGAREILSAVMRDLEQALEQASELGDSAAVLEVNRFLGVASVNLGRAALECGDPAMAIAFARAWLSDPECGEAAESLMGDALDSNDLNPLRLAELSLASGRVTPAVVALLIESALANSPPNLSSIERAVAEAQASLPSGWWSGEALGRLLNVARVELGRAVMRNEARAEDYPALLSLPAK